MDGMHGRAADAAERGRTRTKKSRRGREDRAGSSNKEWR